MTDNNATSTDTANSLDRDGLAPTTSDNDDNQTDRPKRKKNRSEEGKRRRKEKDAMRKAIMRHGKTPKPIEPTVYDDSFPLDYYNRSFIDGLQRNYAWASTTDDYLRAAMQIKGTNNERLLHLSAALREAKLEPINSVHSAKDLEIVINGAFEYIQISEDSQLCKVDYGVDEHIAEMGPKGYLPVEITMPNGKREWKNMFQKDIREAWEEDVPFNALNAWPPPVQFVPSAIRKVSLLHKIRLLNKSGEINRHSVTTPTDTWSIITKGPADSPFHADQGGKCTFVVSFEGEKFWFVPNGDWVENLIWLDQYGTLETTYPSPDEDGRSLSCIQLRPGVGIIMAPGRLHSVITPEHCLLGGTFFYTAEHFAATIQCYQMYYKDTLASNDDLKPTDIQEVITIIESLDTGDLFTPLQLNKVWIQMTILLKDAGCLVLVEDSWIVETKTSGWREYARERPALNLFKACSKWWRVHNKAHLSHNKEVETTEGSVHDD